MCTFQIRVKTQLNCFEFEEDSFKIMLFLSGMDQDVHLSLALSLPLPPAFPNICPLKS